MIIAFVGVWVDENGENWFFGVFFLGERGMDGARVKVGVWQEVRLNG